MKNAFNARTNTVQQAFKTSGMLGFLVFALGRGDGVAGLLKDLCLPFYTQKTFKTWLMSLVLRAGSWRS
jgi:hypothetical protein